jgi:hypothetical protein
VLDYEGAIQVGKYLLVAHGLEAEVAREILSTARAESTK